MIFLVLNLFYKQIEPKTFPIDGSTTITITGSNIGQNREDILGVTLADEPCTVTKYETSKT